LRVGLLWRVEWDPIDAYASVVDECKLRGTFAAFSALGIEAEPVVYSDATVAPVRDQLLALDGVLVWVNPIQNGLDRSHLDTLLREATSAGVWVSADPDVILKMGTKEVLVDTRNMGWGTDTHLYRTGSELREHLPGRLADGKPLVLKQRRGMGGAGVWKVELDPTSPGGKSAQVRVQHAASDGMPERLPLDEFVRRCEPYFAGPGLMVEQPFQPRLRDGMIRAYLTHDKVVGFAHQYPRGLLPAEEASSRPTSKAFELASAPHYAQLRAPLESEWVPELQKITAVATHELPVIWDADFLYGPKAAAGDDTYVLCEINVSSVFAIPDEAPAAIARRALDRLRLSRRR
jgi:hypothetical protein